MLAEVLVMAENCDPERDRDANFIEPPRADTPGVLWPMFSVEKRRYNLAAAQQWGSGHRWGAGVLVHGCALSYVGATASQNVDQVRTTQAKMAKVTEDQDCKTRLRP